MTIAVRVRALVHGLVILSLLCVAPGSAAPRAAEAQGSGNISYVYDPLGRLIGVLDGVGGVAKYQYDAVGNLLAIKREGSTPVLVTSVAPLSGAVGATVTITGTGFSTTPSLNTVQFVGSSGPVSAAVTSATATQLVVTVPTGALTGSITVSTPSDTAGTTTAAAFTVLDASGRDTRAPTITSVTSSPNVVVNGYPIAAAGSTITIAGTNLETTFSANTAINTAANNVVAINGQRATVSQGADASHINATLPTTASSGPLTLTTPGGTAANSTDLFVPPSGYTPANVAFADTMSVGGTKTITTSANATQTIALVAFDASAGQALSLQLSNIQYSGSCNPSISILAPNGTSYPGPSCRDTFAQTPVLPATGTYTVLVVTGGNAGQMTIALQAIAPDTTNTITINGPAVRVTISTPGQNALLSFQGSAGESVTLHGQNSTDPQYPGFPSGLFDCLPTVAVQDRTRTTTLATGSCKDISAITATLPTTGAYAILVDPSGAATGTLFLTLTLAGTSTPTPTSTPTNTPTAGASPTPTSTPTPNGSPTLTFTPTKAPTATPLTGPALVVRPSSIAPGGVASVDWGGLFPPVTPTTNDWIGLYTPSQPDSPAATVTVTTTGGVSGQVAFAIPTSLATGTYQMRLFNGTGTGSRLAVSNNFSVTLTTSTPTSSPTSGASPTPTSTATAGPSPTPGASLLARPNIIPQGSTVNATWAGIQGPTARDWIGLFAAGAPPPTVKPTTYQYTTGQASGQVPLSIPSAQAPGSYELRLFANDTFTLLATSNSFAVTAPSGGLMPPDALATTLRLPDAVGVSPSGARIIQLLSAQLRQTVDPTASGNMPPAQDAGEGAALTNPSWSPELGFVPNLLRLGHTATPWRLLPPLAGTPGSTALAGQVLQLNGQPLADVTLQLGTVEARTDTTGRFLLDDLAPGHQELVIDGRSASDAERAYGQFFAGVDLVEGERTVLPYTIWLPRLDTLHTIAIPAPTTEETVLTTPKIPGLEVHLPPGTEIRDREGNVVTELGITAIPVDRPPFPLPPGAPVPIYFTIQPGGATIAPYGARIVYPNYTHAAPGTRGTFWHYDPVQDGWYIYGRGTVTADGTQAIPDPGVAVFELTGAMFHAEDGPQPPGTAPPPGNDTEDGEPVDLSTGLFVLNKTDLALPDVLPLRLTRTYRPLDAISRPFGIGATHPYEMYLYAPYGQEAEGVSLVLPDGGQVVYLPTVFCPGGGVDCASVVYTHTATPTPFYNSQLTYSASDHRWHITLRDGTVYLFGDGAPLQAIRDRYGNQITLARNGGTNAYGDNVGNVTQITSPNGRWIRLTYDTNSPPRITGAEDNIGRAIGYTYYTTYSGGDPRNGHLATVTLVDGSTTYMTQYTYDPSTGALTQITDAKGITYLTNSYYANGRVSQQTLNDGTANPPTYQFSYVDYSPPTSRVQETAVTDPRGIVRRVQFDTRGYTISDTRAYTTPQYPTNPPGPPEQQTSTYTRRADGLVESMTDPLGHRTTYDYDPWGMVTRVTRLAEQATPYQLTTLFSYEDRFHQVASVTDPLQHTTTYTYDALGNITVITDPLGHYTVLTYNAAGQPLSLTDPLDNTTRFAYALGDLVQVTDPLNRTSARFVDNAGRLVTTTNALGQTTRREYDGINLVREVTDALGQHTTFGYDLNGNLISVTDARNNTTSYNYDNMDRLSTRTDALGQVNSTGHQETYQYDKAGNVIQVTDDRRGKITTYCYDGLNRRTFAGFGTVTPPGACAAGANYESTIISAYDGWNRLTQAVDSASGTTTRTYDDVQRTMTETTPQGTVSYQFDPAGRRTMLTASGQAPVGYTFDDANRLVQLVQGATTVGLAYDPANRQTQLTLPNGVSVTHGYDAAGQLTSLSYSQNNSTLGNLGYSYDLAGQRTSLTGSFARTGLPTALTSATYDAANRLTQWGTTSITYENTNGGNMLTDGAHTYSWNARSQLSQVVTSGTTTTFAYDALGRRQTSTVVPPAPTPTVTTSYLYARVNPIQEQASTGTANLLTGLGLDQYFARTESSTTRSYLTDALGSTLALVGASGVETQYTCDPFGNTMPSGPASTNPYQYTGRENDTSTGLYYYRARYYNPAIERFISEDPLLCALTNRVPLASIVSYPQSLNAFVYALDDPVDRRDPLGLTSDCEYYQQRCHDVRDAISQGYYCQAAPTVCQRGGDNPYSNCVRGCLQAADSAACVPIVGRKHTNGVGTVACAVEIHAACFATCLNVLNGRPDYVPLPPHIIK